MRLIGVVGRRGSGKGVFAEAAREMRIPAFEMSDVVVEKMLKTDRVINNKTLREYADWVRKKYGQDYVARKTIERIRKEAGKARTAVVVGIRSPAEIRAFRKAFKETVVLSLRVPLNERWARVQKRKRPEDARDLEGFLWAERMEDKWGLGKAIEQADVIIRNCGLRKSFKEQAKRLIAGLG